MKYINDGKSCPKVCSKKSPSNVRFFEEDPDITCLVRNQKHPDNLCKTKKECLFLRSFSSIPIFDPRPSIFSACDSRWRFASHELNVEVTVLCTGAELHHSRITFGSMLET